MKLVSVLVLLLAPVLTSCDPHPQPLDCSYKHEDGFPTGVYAIYPKGPTSGVEVYCDMDTDQGFWTVIQRRMDGSVNFYRPWDHYKRGFGSAAGEYWLGLDNIHYLSTTGSHELRVDMEDFEGNKVFATYSKFSVGAEHDGYVLTVEGFTDGGAGDALDYHNGQKFSTFDRDQDDVSVSCAKKHLGAFWFKDCHQTNLNGVYLWGADGTLNALGMSWFPWKGHAYSLKTINMKMRPVW